MSGSLEAKTLEDAQSVKAIIGIEKRKKIEYGYCQCGCGAKTWVPPQNFKTLGYTKGEPVRFKAGHNLRVNNRGPNANGWKGGITFDRKRKMIYTPNHHSAGSDGYVYNYVLVAEKATGLKIKKPAEIHHVNEDPSDDSNGNLVICQDHEYHYFIASRRKALLACGHAKWKKCVFCKKYDDPENMISWERTGRPSRTFLHKSCLKKYEDRIRVKASARRRELYKLKKENKKKEVS